MHLVHRFVLGSWSRLAGNAHLILIDEKPSDVDQGEAVYYVLSDSARVCGRLKSGHRVQVHVCRMAFTHHNLGMAKRNGW
jgi:hypothetical protein